MLQWLIYRDVSHLKTNSTSKQAIFSFIYYFILLKITSYLPSYIFLSSYPSLVYLSISKVCLSIFLPIQQPIYLFQIYNKCQWIILWKIHAKSYALCIYIYIYIYVYIQEDGGASASTSSLTNRHSIHFDSLEHALSGKLVSSLRPVLLKKCSDRSLEV